jgi:broad specificity phosphatase PhoE
MTAGSSVPAGSGDTYVYLVRHAEPFLPDHTWRFIGARSNPPLSPEGIAHAQELTARFEHVRLDEVWSSGLARSLQTAEIASGQPAGAIRIETRLQEVDLGLWDGLSGPEIRERYPREYAERESDLVGYRFPGGESFRELQGRAVAGLVAVVGASLQAGADHILAVAHKSANRVILCHFLGLPLDQMFTIKQEYCAVNVLRAAVDDGGSPRIRVEELAT